MLSLRRSGSLGRFNCLLTKRKHSTIVRKPSIIMLTCFTNFRPNRMRFTLQFRLFCLSWLSTSTDSWYFVLNVTTCSGKIDASENRLSEPSSRRTSENGVSVTFRSNFLTNVPFLLWTCKGRISEFVFCQSASSVHVPVSRAFSATEAATEPATEPATSSTTIRGEDVKRLVLGGMLANLL